MKTLILHLKRFSIYSLMFASIGFVACEDENRQDMTPEIGEGEAKPQNHYVPADSRRKVYKPDFIRYAFRHGFG